MVAVVWSENAVRVVQHREALQGRMHLEDLVLSNMLLSNYLPLPPCRQQRGGSANDSWNSQVLIFDRNLLALTWKPRQLCQWSGCSYGVGWFEGASAWQGRRPWMLDLFSIYSKYSDLDSLFTHLVKVKGGSPGRLDLLEPILVLRSRCERGVAGRRML